MSAQILDILELPEDRQALGRWLDRALVGLELQRVTDELVAIHGRADDSVSLKQIIGPAWEDVLKSGTSAISTRQMQALLRHPALLLELQAMVLCDGGQYWDQVLATEPDIVAAVDRGRWRLRTGMALRMGGNRISTATGPHRRWFAQPSVVSIATAAVVLIAVGLLRVMFPTPSPIATSTAIALWGWERPAALAADVDRKVYLTRLADAADEWFAQRPDTAPALAQRLLELRHGCTNLLLANHAPLTADDRQWLMQKCAAWARDIDQQLVDLESNQGTGQVLIATDAIVHKLSGALRDRSKKAV